ncbi:DUF488 family protein [Agrococcus jenensis]|uniref:Uncharacterized protein DUF488 n=1 Tax=Agrococcus jenensis TaxID=46353 RepID=A0A3N2AT19_9MICO|nr:uncharacterized protein DUF488 [Agrococcus jenensis]
MSRVLTIGHSTHSIERFIALLSERQVTAIADVRSVPASRFTPQFNREALSRALRAAGIAYVFLGSELGARSPVASDYCEGKVQYSRLASSATFASGVRRVIDGASRESVALMCSEQEPLDCHRTILVSRILAERGVGIGHIHGDGSVESHDDAMARLRKKHHLDGPSLIDTDDQLLERALELQEAEIAYVDKRLALH